MEISEIRNQIAQNRDKMASFRDNLDLDRLEEEIALLDNDMSDPSFWDDNIAAQKVVEQCDNTQGIPTNFKWSKFKCDWIDR
jgi:peptide chain release factor 2